MASYTYDPREAARQQKAMLAVFFNCDQYGLDHIASKPADHLGPIMWKRLLDGEDVHKILKEYSMYGRGGKPKQAKPKAAPDCPSIDSGGNVRCKTCKKTLKAASWANHIKTASHLRLL